MLEGLEISEVNLSQLEFSGRLDSEYYKRLFLDYERLVASKNYTLLKSVSDFLIGPFGSAFTVDNYVDCKDYRYIRGKDVKPFLLKSDDNVYMPKHDYERLAKYSLRENDILVSVVGTCGNAALITNKDLPAIFSCKSTVLRIRGITPAYLLSYINCEYGRNLLFRKERGAIQKGLNLGDLEELPIFIPSNVFQSKIDVIFRDSLSKTSASKKLYAKAEQILLEEIDLLDFKPSQESVNIKSFKDSFGTSGRLDAEYYQKKYECIEKRILNNKNGFTFTQNEFQKITLKIEKNKAGYNYIEISDVNVSDGSCQSNYVKTSELPANAKLLVKKGDILISKVRPYRGAVTLINGEKEDLIVSGAFTVLREKESSIFSNEVLKVLLRTKVYKELLLKFNVGTSYPVIKDVDVTSLCIPKIKQDIQEEITSKIQISSALKKQSEHLLEVAKRAVEIAIEEDESAALAYIDEKVNELS